MIYKKASERLIELAWEICRIADRCTFDRTDVPDDDRVVFALTDPSDHGELCDYVYARYIDGKWYPCFLNGKTDEFEITVTSWCDIEGL